MHTQLSNFPKCQCVDWFSFEQYLLFADCSNLKNPKQVERFQEKAHCSLKHYVEKKHPSLPERFAKILLRLPATRMLTQCAAEKLFFSPLIGTVRIESIMNNIMSKLKDILTQDYQLIEVGFSGPEYVETSYFRLILVHYLLQHAWWLRKVKGSDQCPCYVEF